MEKRTKKMLLAILMIISVLAADFLVLGSGIVTFASELGNKTNNENVEFLAYFKEGENRLDSIEKSIMSEDVRLYVEIIVKNEGYLKEGVAIELENSNFNLKNEILESNTHINSIEGNKVNLKQINAGETVEIELGIEPIIADKIETDFLAKISTVKMLGSYVYSKDEEGQSIITEREVSINYQPEDFFEAELETDIITNKVFAVNGENKRLVQLLIKSRLTNNDYPVKETKLTTTIPGLGDTVPEVTAMAKDELATNGRTEISSTTTENGVEIVVKNEPNENNEINWKKGIYDEIIVTYIYPETVDASKIEITTNSEIKLYNSENTYTAQSTKGIENQELNNVIIGKTKITTKELYKGSIYANLETRYNTETSMIITNSDVAEEVVIIEGPDTYGIENGEIDANTKYVSTKINLAEMLEIVGQDGNIEIKNGETVTLVNKESETDENGNVIINHKNGVSDLQIITSKPVKAGILKLRHTKAITGNEYGYTREQLQQVKTIEAKGYIEGNITVNKEKQKIVSNSTETTILELKETTTKAELTIENNKTILSTTEENEVTLGIALITDGVQYDLFKNPRVNLKFPSSVENVELLSEAIKQNAEEFTVSVGNFDATNKTMLIELQGEQTTYPESELTQGYIQLNLKIGLNSLALAQTDKIMMAYTNENASQYENEVNGIGVAEQTVQISAQSQLIKGFNLSSNDNTSYTETITERIKEKQAGKTLDFEISLINNKDSNISNMKILGKLPTTGNTISGQEENKLETTLKGITAENAEIYYTENTKATADTENTENRWTKDLSTLGNAKLYLIKVDSLERGANYKARVTVQLPNQINENEMSYTQYGVIYDTATETGVTESSRKIGLLTTEVPNINTQITAQVGQDILKDGDIVKEGEVIRYTVTVTNNEKSTLENIQLKLDIPEGTVLLRPRALEDYKYETNAYFEEITDSKKIEELTTRQITKLTTNKSYTIEYEVRVKQGTVGTEIINTPIVTYKDIKIENIQTKYKVQKSDIRVTIENLAFDNTYLRSGGDVRYRVFIENLSDTSINDLELQIISDGITVNFIDTTEYTGSFIIDEITSKNESIEEETGIRSFVIYGKAHDNIGQFDITAKVKDNNQEVYRSNVLKEIPEKVEATISMNSPQKGNVIKEGDIVEYNILVKNTGKIETPIKFKAPINKSLEIQEIYLNNELKNKNTDELWGSNNVQMTLNLKSQEQAQIKIVAKVKFIPYMYHGKTLTNRASISISDTEEIYSEIITHILKAKDLESFENVISGYIWYDENEDGKRDINEETLSGIKVKLYDINEKKYLNDEGGNLLLAKIEEDGQYLFSKIKNGSYLVIFEYDTEKYVLTKQLADNVDSSLNSKAGIKTIIEERYIERVAAIEINDLKQNIIEMNMGLKENIGDVPAEEQPGIEEIPEEPNIPEDPTNPEKPAEPEQPNNPDKPTEPEGPGQPNNPDKPTEPEDPTNPDKPEEPTEPGIPEKPGNTDNIEQPTQTKTLSGFAWLDSNGNGRKDKDETYLSGIKVRLYNVDVKEYMNNITSTDEEGRYRFNNVEKGSYIVIFEYDTEQYKLSKQNKNIVLKKVNINGKEVTAAVTETINVQNNVSNINIGLKENLKFDLELNKYISKIVTQTSKETKTYNYEGKTLGKVEIHRKQIQGANVVLEYTIKVKNTGELAGYAKNVVDYLPSGLTFSSELNRDWYMSGNYLYTRSLEDVEIKPGEEKEVKLILTKTMTNNNVGLINNRAEIYQDYNIEGEVDIDSTPNNQNQNEDDFGTTDVIIQVATGGSIIAYIMLAMINIALVYVAITIMIKNGIIEIKTKEGRR